MGILRDQMALELRLRGYSPKTVQNYLANVEHFVAYFRRPLPELGETEIRQYLDYLLSERKLSFSSANLAYSALRFCYQHVLQQPWNIAHLPRAQQGKTLPEVLSVQEVESLLAHVTHRKYLAILAVIYSAGLRVSEAVHLRVEDIDSKRMTIRIRQGKGQQDRYTLLAQRTLHLLRTYFRCYRPSTWLFPGTGKGKPLSTRAVQLAFQEARVAAGIAKKATVHTLRHSFATHLLDRGTDITHIRRLLGHRRLETTAIYLHVTNRDLARLASPFDRSAHLAPPLPW